MSYGMPSERDQAAIVDALASGAATGDDQPLKRIDTHMSHLFLGRARAYKLKRSVRHPFADMRSIEARRLACEAELAVNRPLASDLYEAVLPVVRDTDQGITVGGPGEVVDWVVVMQRFSDGALLEEIANAGRLTPELVIETSEVVASFHAGLPVFREAGHAVDYRRIIEGLRRTEAAGAAALGVQPASASLFDALELEVARHAPLIEARRRDGWVRRGHGDLHLRNICLYKDRVTPFDALEFDPSLATSDVLYDAAFLFMDLQARGLHALANTAMNRYWDAAQQPEEGLALLPLFLALRAAVRMAVSVEGGDLVQAERYRTLAIELLRPAIPRLLAIGGLSGSGKSTLATAVAPMLPGPCGARLLRTDVIRKSAAGVAPTHRLAAETYQPDARADVYRWLADHAHDAITAGSSVIADATFQEDCARADIEAAAGDAELIGFWLRTPTEVRIARVARRQNDASDATAEVARQQEDPQALGDRWRVLDASRSLDVLSEDLLRKLGGGSGPGRRHAMGTSHRSSDA
jgi:uncharacterized protein